GLTLAWYHYYQEASGPQDKIGIYPYFEYPFSDKLSLRSVYRGLTFYNSTTSPGDYTHDDATQSLGLGWSVTRDVYFFPNIQWVWADMRPEKTNVAMTAYLNL